MREIWKGHFHILNAINLIDSVSNQVSYRALNSTRKKLCPECGPNRDHDGFEMTLVLLSIAKKLLMILHIIDDIVTIGQSMGLEVDGDDIEDLLKDHGNHRTNHRRTQTLSK